MSFHIAHGAQHFTLKKKDGQSGQRFMLSNTHEYIDRDRYKLYETIVYEQVALLSITTDRVLHQDGFLEDVIFALDWWAKSEKGIWCYKHAKDIVGTVLHEYSSSARGKLSISGYLEPKRITDFLLKWGRTE